MDGESTTFDITFSVININFLLTNYSKDISDDLCSSDTEFPTANADKCKHPPLRYSQQTVLDVIRVLHGNLLCNGKRRKQTCSMGQPLKAKSYPGHE